MPNVLITATATAAAAAATLDEARQHRYHLLFVSDMTLNLAADEPTTRRS